MLGHAPRLVGLETHQCTGWKEVGPDGARRYAPHTEAGYRAPPNKHLLLLLNGALRKRQLCGRPAVRGRPRSRRARQRQLTATRVAPVWRLEHLGRALLRGACRSRPESAVASH